nr:BRCA2-interacting transcriptional repressor EMSY isoform X2 [Nomia melanderi]
MWPARHETMTRDECRKCLRYLELDAYGSMVSVLRAQGPFTSEKQKLLQELAKVLHISNERHRAEVRRAVNDEKLAMIAEQLSGPNTGTDWTIEGRRVIPLLPRLKARSAFTTLANSLSIATVAANKRNLPIREKTEDAKDIRSESPVKVKVEEKILGDNELSPVKEKLNEENITDEISEQSKKANFNNQNKNSDTNEKCAMLEKRKPTSPLPTPLPNKILVVSANSIGTLNHGTASKGSLENTIQLSRVPTNSLQHQNFTIIPLNINCGENDSDLDSKTVVQENVINHIAVSPSNLTNTIIPVDTTSIAKTKGKIITTQSKLNTKIGSAILRSSNVPCTSGNNLQCETQDTPTQNSISSSQKSVDSENSNVTASSTKRIIPMIHSNATPPITKTITTNNSHRLISVCPGTTVSNGPGPPQLKQTTTTTTTTTVTCKKLPTTLNNQIAAKMEVLGKVIMGGKNLCVTNQHNASINVLPRHITLNNGDQSVTMLSTTNSSQTESIAPNAKSGNTIMFNLRQEVLEKNKALTHLFESTNVLTSESKTVIQNAHARVSKEPSNSDSHVQDKEIIVKTDAVITSVRDEKHRTFNTQ